VKRCQEHLSPIFGKPRQSRCHPESLQAANRSSLYDEGGYEVVKVFTGSDARQQAIRYAEREFGAYDEVRLPPYRRP
jgi:hypothetical protein